MKVVCVNTVGHYHLTIGKTYEVIVEEEYHYHMKNDTNEEWPYNKSGFKTIPEYRNEKINKLLEV